MTGSTGTDPVVALAGNPNTGKSTVFNALTGLRQHTGNWPGKTVARAEGTYTLGGRRYKVVDLPGTYSLQATSEDEKIARDFLLFGRPDVTVVVVDATRLERNLYLVLQVLRAAPRVVVCLNLMDEARRKGWRIDDRRLAEDLGVPVVPTVARRGEGLDRLVAAIADVAAGAAVGRPRVPEAAGTHERWTEALYAEAERIADRAVSRPDGPRRLDLDLAIDRLVTSRLFGFPLMFLLFTAVFWATIRGANVPSALLADALIGTVHPALRGAFGVAGAPGWLTGAVVDGAYLATAWVVSVMFPPMAIFFPLFTILEDLGYLPRVAFNLDGIFRRCGAHGKQCLTMMMGYGCNAAGVIAARIIDSPRERLIAILTNNFAICNGRWPTQILLATIFIGAVAPPAWGATVAAASVVGVAVVGVGLSLAVSWALSRTVLRGEVSTFHLELPPYRPPRILQTLYTSFIDRTIFVLRRAVVFAIPAGLATWVASNVEVGGASLAAHAIRLVDPFGALVGLNGVILVAYVFAIPANEIVIPTILMLTVLATGAAGGAGAGVLFETGADATLGILRAGGWTTLTAVNLMIFSLVHNPCATTIYTIYKETGSARWTAVAALLPIGMGLGICLFVAQVWRTIAG